MVALVANGTFWWLPVSVIALRKLGIQAFRSYWGRRGLAVPATAMAKAKTVVQEVAVGFGLLPLTVDDATWVATGLLWIALVLTVVSGAQYVAAGSRAATTAGRRYLFRMPSGAPHSRAWGAACGPAHGQAPRREKGWP